MSHVHHTAKAPDQLLAPNLDSLDPQPKPSPVSIPTLGKVRIVPPTSNLENA